MRRTLALSTALSLLFPLATAGASPGDPIVAVRRAGELTVDGRLEEPAWDLAPPFDAFVQRFPDEGAPPTERTEVRVLWDDRTLYVGVRCLDRRPEAVQRPLGRRDAVPFSDQVTLVLDSMGDGRTGYQFTLNAAGVQADALLSDDDEQLLDWDAVWDGAAAATHDGWSAELAIPLAALRFTGRPGQPWGVAVRRTLARRHEETLSVSMPRSARGQLARLAPLLGLSGLAPARDLEVAPYSAARLALRPRYDDAARPRPRLANPVGDLGVDVKAAVGRGLSLQATVNPDFAQVEADQLLLNLSSYELFFPEKRPFFTQGMDLFQPVAPQGRRSPQQLFYSRRIGLDGAILGAAKVTGSVSDTLQVGVVEAFVAGAGSGLADGEVSRTYRFSAEQPLRFAPRSALPALAPAPANHLAAVARWRPDPTRAFGATVTSTLLTGPRCTAAEDLLDDDRRPRRCDALAGQAAAADWSLRTRDGEWFFRGQATGSQALGGAPERVLADGTVLRRGDLGFGAHAAAGRQGGEPWRFEVHWEYESPRLELNASGYQRTQNEQLGRALLRYVRPGGGGPFHDYGVVLGAEQRLTTDGTGLDRGAQAWLAAEVQLRSFHQLGCMVLADRARWDVREVRGAGVALRLPAAIGGECWATSDPSRRVQLGVDAWAGRTSAAAPLPSRRYGGAAAKAVLRPHPRLETRVDVQVEGARWPVRYVADGAPDADGTVRARYLADLRAPTLSVTLRQQLVLTPRLTLQGYAQLFTAYGRHGQFYEARAARGERISLADLRPVERPLPGATASPDFENPDFREGLLDVDVVLRWEYRLGSTLFLVYQRSQSELGWPDAPADPSPPATLRPRGLGGGPAVDTFLVKWTYRWSG